MGQSNPQLRDALKKLSAAKYGRPRAQVEKEIFARLGAGDAAKKAKLEALKKAQQDQMNRISSPEQANSPKAGSGSSFLDEWLSKRQQIATMPPKEDNKAEGSPLQSYKVNQAPNAPSNNDALHIREQDSDDEVSVRLR
jgi:hypothetical protein